MAIRFSSTLTRLTARFARIAFGVLLPLGVILLMAAVPAFAQTPDPTTSGTSGLALDTMLANMVVNIAGPMCQLVYVGSYIFGIYLLIKALFKCIKYSDEGSKGQQKFSGIWGTFFIGALLIALPNAMNTIGNTLYGSGGLGDAASAASSILNYQTITDTDVQKKITRTYWAIMVFVQIVGLISFTRGLSILRSVTDGNTQVTSMAGLTHVFAGAIAWNLGQFVEVIYKTVGYNSGI